MYDFQQVPIYSNKNVTSISQNIMDERINRLLTKYQVQLKVDYDARTADEMNSNVPMSHPKNQDHKVLKN